MRGRENWQMVRWRNTNDRVGPRRGSKGPRRAASAPKPGLASFLVSLLPLAAFCSANFFAPDLCSCIVAELIAAHNTARRRRYHCTPSPPQAKNNHAGYERDDPARRHRQPLPEGGLQISETLRARARQGDDPVGRRLAEITQGGFSGGRIQSGVPRHARAHGDGRAARPGHDPRRAPGSDKGRGRDRSYWFGGLKCVTEIAADDARRRRRVLHGRHREHVPGHLHQSGRLLLLPGHAAQAHLFLRHVRTRRPNHRFD